MCTERAAKIDKLVERKPPDSFEEVEVPLDHVSPQPRPKDPVWPKEVPSLNFKEINKPWEWVPWDQAWSQSDMMRQSESSCSCTYCMEEKMDAEEFDGIEISADTHPRSIGSSILNEDWEKFKNIKDLKRLYEIMHAEEEEKDTT